MFTSKELDPETGLYYSIKRYYDPRTGMWPSADPAISNGKYFPKPQDFDTDHDYLWRNSHDESEKLPGHGGVFNSVNLNAYHYAGQNPVKFVDPDGEAIQAIIIPVIMAMSTPAGQQVIRQSGQILRYLGGQGMQLLTRAGPAITNAIIHWSGKAHGVPSHMAKIKTEVNELLKSGKYSEIFINKSLKTAGLGNSGLKPDITAIGKNGNKNMIIEVVSPSQTSLQLVNKVQNMIKNLPNTTGKVVKP